MESAFTHTGTLTVFSYFLVTEANTNQVSLEREIEEIDVDVDYKIENQVEQPNEPETEEEIIDDTPVCENYRIYFEILSDYVPIKFRSLRCITL